MLEERHNALRVFNNGYLIIAAVWIMLTLTPAATVEVKDANYDGEQYIAHIPTPTPSPTPTSTPQLTTAPQVIVVTLPPDQTAAQSAEPTLAPAPEQSIIQNLNPAGKVYGYDKDKEK